MGQLPPLRVCAQNDSSTPSLPSGAFDYYNSHTSTQGVSGENITKNSFVFNASLANSIYGSSATVTPLSLSTKLILKY